VFVLRFLSAGVLAVLTCASGALADNPTVRISQADQTKAESSLLQLRDFGVGWTGGKRTPAKLTSPHCPGFDPKESDLVVSGHAEARFGYQRAGVVFDQDTQVLKNKQAVATDFARTIHPKLAGCLAYQLKRSGHGQVTSVKVQKLRFPKVGDVSAAYRAVVTVHSGKRVARIVSDFIFFGSGRLEYSLNVIAPATEGGQLVPFELAMAQILVKRSSTGNVA
jgi:hypothetical protein